MGIHLLGGLESKFLDPSDGVFGRFDLAALCGCRTLNVCLFVLLFWMAKVSGFWKSQWTMFPPNMLVVLHSLFDGDSTGMVSGMVLALELCMCCFSWPCVCRVSCPAWKLA